LKSQKPYHSIALSGERVGGRIEREGLPPGLFFLLSCLALFAERCCGAPLALPPGRGRPIFKADASNYQANANGRGESSSGVCEQMVSEKSRTDMLLANDDRLFPAVSAAIHHGAAHTGMSAEAESALLRKTEDVCAHALPPVHSDPSQGLGARSNGHPADLHISVLEFPDRVEVVLEHPGKLPPDKLKRRDRGVCATAMGFAPQAETAAESCNGVDRIVCEPFKDRIRTTLVQYSHNSRVHS
jgi:hypothetical protein